MTSRFKTRVMIAGTLAVGMAACSHSPTTPQQTVNTPPTIVSLTTSALRIEASDVLTVTANVRDTTTPLDQLVYHWSAAPVQGVFTGSGASVTWRAPRQQTSPDFYTITLTVTAPDTSGQANQNSASSSVQVHYNDSVEELTNLGTDFLVAKFGNFNVSPAQAVSNFSDSNQRQPDGSVCSVEKAQEFDDITGNRAHFHILSATYSVDSITLNDDRTFATMSGLCVFEDIPLATGQQERVPGICTLTGVYENFHWLLCRSNDAPVPGMTATPVELRRYQVPGYRQP